MTSPKRTRRTHDEILEDLEAQMEAVKARKAEKELRDDPGYASARAAVKAIDKAHYLTEDTAKRGALEAAREALGQIVPLDAIRPYQPRQKEEGEAKPRRKRAAKASAAAE